MKAVIFDMDGLMFDTERIYVDAWDYAGEQLGLGKAGYVAVKSLGMSEDESFAAFRREFGESYDEKELIRHTMEYLNDYYANNHVPVKKGLYELLDYLKKSEYKIAVASSSHKKTVEQHLNDAGVFDYFDVIVCGDMIKNPKPAPDIYLKAAEMLGEAPQDCYALEDSRTGLQAACSAGCNTIMIPDMWQPDEQTLSAINAKLDDLEMVIEYIAEN